MHAGRRLLLALLALALPAAFAGGSLASPRASTFVDVAGLQAPAQVVRDSLGVPHISAKSDHDAYFMVGWVHAQDRLFQMDSSRRQASGTLAELLGSAALASDVQLRTLGLRRAAAKSLAVLSPAARCRSRGVQRRGQRVRRVASAAGGVRSARAHALPAMERAR